MSHFSFRRLVPVVGVLLFLSVSISFYVLSPDKILGALGVENAYLLMFLLAFLGGLSTFSGVPYHIVLIALAGSGLNPWLLGVLAACGVTAGDSTSYLLGRRGSELLSSRMRAMLGRLASLEERSPRLVSVVIFLYGALMPFSNDLLVIPAGMLGYPFLRVMTLLGVGNILFNVGLALLAVQAGGFLAGFLS
ncbi:MAG: VTT domain-containing protein [Candidatus Pacebacteria bacterium]|nr:VTT domain-containing protein [Candidatus Paceibacterota bacterium]